MEYIEVPDSTDLFYLLYLPFLLFIMLPLVSTHLYVFILIHTYLIYLSVVFV